MEDICITQESDTQLEKCIYLNCYFVHQQWPSVLTYAVLIGVFASEKVNILMYMPSKNLKLNQLILIFLHNEICNEIPIYKNVIT